MNLKLLKEPFEEKDIEWRLSQCGKTKNGDIWAQCLAYISARAIQDRLDEVVGPENWQVKYDVLDKGIVASLSIRTMHAVAIPNSISSEALATKATYEWNWISKEDGAEQTDIEAFKGGLSSALKRAGSAWGIGRYLYGLESGFGTIVDKTMTGAKYGKTKEGEVFYWVPPRLPSWALPKNKVPETKTPVTAITTKEIEALIKKVDPTDNNSAEKLIKNLESKPQSSKWGDYTIKSDKFNKGKTLKQVGLPWVLKQLEYWKGKELKSKGLSADMIAFEGFHKETADSNPPKVFKGNTPPPIVDYKTPMHDDDPHWDKQDAPAFDSDSDIPF